MHYLLFVDSFSFLSEDSEARFCLPVELQGATCGMDATEVDQFLCAQRRNRDFFSLSSQRLLTKVEKYEGLGVGRNPKEPDIVNSWTCLHRF